MQRTTTRTSALALALLTTIGACVAAGVLWLAPEAALAGWPVAPWTDADRATLASMTLDRLSAPAPDPSNAVATKPEAAALGQRLFADPRLSRNGQVSCASCHRPELGFQDGLPLGRGVATGSRRTMPIAAAAHSPWFFWDGRKDSLWSQALGPLEDAAEHGGNRLHLVRVLGTAYRPEYERLFGPFPSLEGMPTDAGPLGDASQQQAWSRLSESQRDAVNRAFSNLGKALAAYERTLTVGESRFDRYVNALLRHDAAGQAVLTSDEIKGLRLFIGKAQCVTCHNGPLLSDQSFHNTGVPPRDPARLDHGRGAAVARVRQDEFNCLGRYSDAPPDACAELRFIADDDPGLEGAFRTPGLRNVAERAPYMHAGQIASLDEVVAHYVRAPDAAVGRSELREGAPGTAPRPRIVLRDDEARDLVAFLGTLSAPAVSTAERP